jgi:hypothetical protein
MARARIKDVSSSTAMRQQIFTESSPRGKTT